MGNSTLHGEPPAHYLWVQHVLDRNLLAHVCYRKWTPVDRGCREAIGQWTRSRLAHPSLLLPASVLRLRGQGLALSGRVSISRFLRPALFFNRRAGTWGQLGTGQLAQLGQNCKRQAGLGISSASNMSLLQSSICTYVIWVLLSVDAVLYCTRAGGRVVKSG